MEASGDSGNVRYSLEAKRIHELATAISDTDERMRRKLPRVRAIPVLWNEYLPRPQPYPGPYLDVATMEDILDFMQPTDVPRLRSKHRYSPKHRQE